MQAVAPKNRRIAATALLMFALASVIACGSGSGAKTTPTDTPLSTATRSPSAATTASGSATSSFYSVYFVDAQRGWVAGIKDGSDVILATSDGGKTWIQQYSGTQSIGNLQFVSPLIGWASSPPLEYFPTSVQLLRTTDSGRSWKVINSNADSLSSFSFVDSEHGWAKSGPTKDAAVVQTTDGGRTWSEVSALPGLASLCFNDATYGWAVSDGRVVRTADGGRTWGQPFIEPDYLKPATPGFGSNLRPQEVSCTRPRGAWALFICCTAAFHEGYALFHTSGEAGDWEPVLANVYPQLKIESGAGAEPGSLDVRNSGQGAFLSVCGPCQKHVWVQLTADAGTSWTHTGPIADIDTTASLSYPDASHGWILGRVYESSGKFHSVILATTDGGKTWVQQYP